MPVQGSKDESEQEVKYKSSMWKLTEALCFREDGREVGLCLVNCRLMSWRGGNFFMKLPVFFL